MAASLQVRIKPNSRRPGIEIDAAGIVRAAVNAPPIDGKANEALIEMLSDALDVPKSHLSIIRGQTSKNKAVSVAGLTAEEALARLKEK
jgi:uncharacterized protein